VVLNKPFFCLKNTKNNKNLSFKNKFIYFKLHMAMSFKFFKKSYLHKKIYNKKNTWHDLTFF